jgi:hypothetical protein
VQISATIHFHAHAEKEMHRPHYDSSHKYRPSNKYRCVPKFGPQKLVEIRCKTFHDVPRISKLKGGSYRKFKKNHSMMIPKCAAKVATRHDVTVHMMYGLIP